MVILTAVDEVQKIRKEPVGYSRTSAKRHKFRYETSPKLFRKLKKKYRLANLGVIRMTDEVTRLANYEASLPVLMERNAHSDQRTS